MSLGREIKKARIDRGWTQTRLHELTGLSKKYLSQIECDHVHPSIATVVRIADVLDVSLDALMERRPCLTSRP